MRLGHTLLVVALGLWTGGLAALGLVAAPTIFRTAGSRAVAGQVFGSVLRAFAWVEIVLACVAVAGFLFSRPAGRADWIRGAMLALMVVLLASYAFGVNPAVTAAREACGSFDREPANDAERAARVRFDRLHKLSERLVGANLLLGLALLAWTAASRRP